MAASFGSSTTHRIVRSRLSSRQIRQRSPSATLPHSRQNEIRSFASTIAAARRLASSGGAFTSQNASRCADFGPMPGRRASSSISSWIGPSNIRRSPALVDRCGAEHLLHPAQRLAVVRRILLVDDGDRRGLRRRSRDSRTTHTTRGRTPNRSDSAWRSSSWRPSTFCTANFLSGGNASSSVSPSNDATVALSRIARRIGWRSVPR